MFLHYWLSTQPFGLHLEPLGRFLGSTWSLLGGTWSLLGASWAQLGRSWAQLGRSEAPFQLNLAALGALLGVCWAYLGSEWSPKYPPSVDLGSLGVNFERIFRQLSPILTGFFGSDFITEFPSKLLRKNWERSSEKNWCNSFLQEALHYTFAFLAFSVDVSRWISTGHR